MGKYNTRGASKRIQRNVVVTKENSLSIAGPDDDISTSKEINKKRKATKSTGECDKETKKIKRTNNSHDSYCWKCHRIETESECSPEIQCSTCLRAFHPSCIKATKIDKDKSCYVCQQQANAKTTSNIDDEIHLSKLLLHIMDTACPMDSEEYKAFVDWQDSEENEKLICKKDFRLMHDRCIQKGIQYESHTEFVDDVEWIHHNCIITYGDKSPIATSAKKILLKVQRMLKDALDCPECYYKKIGNEPLTFLNICKTPHPLVWAKVKGWSYWPAKCLKVLAGKAHVRFFHTHQIASVPLSNVLAMSEDYPSSSSKTLDKKSKNSIDFVMANSELEAYIGIFKDNYGTFPYEPINTPFDFEKEEKIMMVLVENHSRKTIVSGDTFLSSPHKESENYPAVVDLTDDVIEDGDCQMQEVENVAPTIHETHKTGDLFEQDVPMDTANDADDDFSENATRSATEANNCDNDQSLMDTINNDAIIKTGFQDSMDVLQGNSKEFQSIQQAISGSLLPSQTSDDQNWLTQRIPSPAGISISNVISGTDVPSGTDLLADAEPVMQNTNFAMSMPTTEPYHSTSVFPQNSIPSSDSLQLCLRNYDRAAVAGDLCNYPPSTYQDDDADIEIIDEVSSSNTRTKINKTDTECILQTILRYDPRFYTALKQANMLVQQLFIQFWGVATNIKKPESVVQTQAYEIRNLKSRLDEMGQEISLLKSEKLQNADNIVRILRAELKSQIEKYDRDFEKYKEDKHKVEEQLEKANEENEKQAAEFMRLLEKSERRVEERLREMKTIKQCDLIECSQPAKYLCCYVSINSYAYCSEKCKAKDVGHGNICAARQRTGSIQQPDEKNDATPEQVVARGVVQQSTTVFYSLMANTNTGITSSSASPQTSSANMHKINKVVSAKKTFEVARNIRNQNSSDIY